MVDQNSFAQREPPGTVKWQCFNCDYVWDGKPNEERTRRATCPKCGHWNVYPGWPTKKWSQVSAIVKNMRGNECERCHATNKPLHVHHKVPVWDGGSSNLDNLEVICANCHPWQHFGSRFLRALGLRKRKRRRQWWEQMFKE